MHDDSIIANMNSMLEREMGIELKNMYTIFVVLENESVYLSRRMMRIAVRGRQPPDSR
jgi:hypothetical protein